MRILYHHRTQGQGVEGVHIRGMVSAFKALGCEVDLVSPPFVDPFQQSRAGAKPQNNTPARGSWEGFLRYCPQVIFEVAEIMYNFYSSIVMFTYLSRNKYSFIYERYSLFGFATTLISRLFSIPLIMEVNDATVIERTRPLVLKTLATLIEHAVFSRSKKVITISLSFKNLLVHAHQLPADKVVVMTNAIDPARFQHVPNARYSKGDLGITGKTVIGVVGAFVKWHGLDFLLTSLHGIVKKYCLHILLVGDGPVMNDVKGLVAKYEIKESVTITGFVSPDKVPDYIGLMDICVMPNSNQHGSPVKILEYMAMGKAIVAPEYQPIKEILTDGHDALLFPPLDPAGFKTSIVRLIEDNDLRADLGTAAKEKVFREFTWKNNAQGTLDLLSETSRDQ
ncbi:MAG: glycosyltransferase family 4 protein [Syntrophaceae bacterium]|nr:glycosyltransferase family 4 protein [Syntrophaceae bacterium]